MKRIYALLFSFVAILTVALLAGCSKTAAKPEAGQEIRGYAIYSVDSLQVGTVSITEVAGGEAKVSISLERSHLRAFSGVIQPVLHNSEPISILNPVNPESGISETSPVKAIDKDLTVSYDLLMFTRDLKLLVSDGNQKMVGSAKLR